ncbi:Hypothetical protein HVR_LOCUS473, partial [uncultured virus]
VKWQDNARSKGSVWGPVISDVTLDVDGQSFPIIGPNNFEDPTFDMPIGRFSVNVGNEKAGEQLRRISFKEYLENLSQHISANVKGPMFLPRDEKILTSAQSCVLPLRDGKVSFNVRIHNYQYDDNDPAVLTVVMSPHGTSAQLLTEYKQKIFFNKCGQKAPYVGERLTDVRVAAGKSTEGPMTQEEKENNVLFVAQIPLKQKERPFRSGMMLECCAASAGSMPKSMMAGSMPKSMMAMPVMAGSRGMDHAQLSIGDSVGPWTGTSSKYTLERDARYPIRITVQYYRVTDTDTIPDDVTEEISRQILKLYEEAPTSEKGSLVTNSPCGRLTEPILSKPPVIAVPYFTF